MKGVDDPLGKRLLPFVLSIIAGSVDVIGFLGLGGLFIAADTGAEYTLIHLARDGSIDRRFRRPRGPGRATDLAVETDGSVLVTSSTWSRPRQSVGLRRIAGLGDLNRG